MCVALLYRAFDWALSFAVQLLMLLLILLLLLLVLLLFEVTF
jgi:hypothetical protein